jgi:hypothetical protein
MSPKFKTFTLWLCAALLFVGFAWSLDVTLFNLWASGGPPVEHPEIYRQRANVFAAISCGLLLACVVLVWNLIRRQRSRSNAAEKATFR